MLRACLLLRHRSLRSGTLLAFAIARALGKSQPTDPPEPGSPGISPTLAAAYLNWAEYISWRNPRVVSWDQYLLTDPPQGQSSFDTGLEFHNGAKKALYEAFRIPVYLPISTSSIRRELEVWGARAARALSDWPHDHAAGGPNPVHSNQARQVPHRARHDPDRRGCTARGDRARLSRELRGHGPAAVRPGSVSARTNNPNSLADGSHTPRSLLAVFLGTPGPVAHRGAGARSVRSRPTPRATAARTIASKGAQPAAGYAAGEEALKCGRVCELGSGARSLQWMNILTRSTPSFFSRSSVAPGFAESSEGASKIVSSGLVRVGPCTFTVVEVPAHPPARSATAAAPISATMTPRPIVRHGGAWKRDIVWLTFGPAPRPRLAGRVTVRSTQRGRVPVPPRSEAAAAGPDQRGGFAGGIAPYTAQHRDRDQRPRGRGHGVLRPPLGRLLSAMSRCHGPRASKTRIAARVGNGDSTQERCSRARGCRRGRVASR